MLCENTASEPPKQNTIAILFSRWPPAYSMMGAAILDLRLRLHICGFCIFSRLVTAILAVLEDFVKSCGVAFKNSINFIHWAEVSTLCILGPK